MEKLDFLWLDCPIPDPEVQHLIFYTKDLGGNAERYRVDANGHLRLLGGLDDLPFEYWQEQTIKADLVWHYTGALDIWTSVQVDGDHSRRFEYRLQFDNGWLKNIEKL